MTPNVRAERPAVDSPLPSEGLDFTRERHVLCMPLSIRVLLGRDRTQLVYVLSWQAMLYSTCNYQSLVPNEGLNVGIDLCRVVGQRGVNLGSDLNQDLFLVVSEAEPFCLIQLPLLLGRNLVQHPIDHRLFLGRHDVALAGLVLRGLVPPKLMAS